ncbi:hypothetical protein BGX38DRAFT_52710 [Terfezia claveryi]|nr:hypothetical protein BGX38DRAFT_52710 [Terfezia claveryi]
MSSSVTSKLTDSVASGQAGSSSSAGNPAAEGLPTEEVVRTWKSGDLYKWLTSMTPPPLSTHEETIKAFLDARIDGPSFLDLGSKWFSDHIARVVPVGVAVRLEMLATTIKHNTLLMSLASPRKRPRSSSPIQSLDSQRKKPRVVGDSGIDIPVAQASAKGSLQSVEELAAANKHATVHKVAVQIKTLDVRLEQFADAKQCILLPFPYAGVIPKRFQLEGQENVFRFFGRTAWKPVYEHVKTMNVMQNNRLHLHGTLGAGKSYLLAGLVCQLQREGMRVVYLPDCYELLLCEPPARYILPSLYSAFYQDPVLGVKVKELVQSFFEKGRTLEDLEWRMIMFCNLAADVERPILWVVDQANALDDGEYDRVSNVKKMQTRRLLDGLCSNHMKLESSTANYSAAKHDEIRATSESRMNLYLGLYDVEMTE